ncbi:MAG TPA: NAD(P)H-hydrate dehydratase [Turneriella sp.]|nr:NAD(P)H-hydrate dehydratase [Turneriella sp.]HNJ66036.1 NAD(P)H-hydrate dehydratase [Turneriella sp.]
MGLLATAMQPVLNRDQMRRYDALVISEGKLPGIVLMENAGRGAFECLQRLLAGHVAGLPHVLIVCGPGNNGGDGYVVARHLLALRNMQATVEVLILADRSQIQGDAAINLESLLALAPATVRFCAPTSPQLEEALARADFVVDAIFGTGLSRPVAGEMLQAIERLNHATAVRVALDVPSGLDCNTGQQLGGCVQAHHTVTFGYPKPGLLTPQGKDKSGELHSVGLGIPDSTILAQTGQAAALLSGDDILPVLSPRHASTFKHRSGDILVVAGSVGKTGAAKLAAHAALRAGAGLATTCTWQEALPALASEVTEIMLSALSETRITEDLALALAKRHAVLVGPGFGTGEAARHALQYILENASVPLVIDADALTMVAQHPELAERIPPNAVLTPHSGELARLLQTTSQQIEADRYAAVASAAEKFRCTVILKGAHTLIGTAQQIVVSPWANPVLATAGSGDVLAGIITALAAQIEIFAAAKAAVYLHGLAGQIWSNTKRADRGMLASDIADTLPEAIARLLGKS